LAGMAVAVTVVALLASARAGGARAQKASQPVIGVAEKDFRITAPRRVRAGRLVLRVTNRGPDTHELFVVRASTVRLPVRPDGVTLDEDALHPRTAGTVDGIPAGRSRTLRVTLAPGRYVLFCNMAGHYLAGMHTELVVG
jgi:uncharacterized cupredoxin-like copper-binding protein